VIATVHIDGRAYRADLSSGRSIAIPLHFDGPQPNSYDVPRATAKAVEAGSFIGDTRRGGSCNFDVVTMIPHCNGTHTECVGHIAFERIAVSDMLPPALSPALLISVRVDAAMETDEHYDPPKNAEDAFITAAAIRAGIEALGIPLPSKLSVEAGSDTGPRSPILQAAPAEGGSNNGPFHPFLEALVIRTLPNDSGKLSRRYVEAPAPFFSLEAMRLLRVLGVAHLLVDIPSLDRAFDEGKMSAHHIFWDVAAGGHEVETSNASPRSVTEFIFVADDITDGRYLLDIQIAPFAADAAPSRPVLYSLIPAEGSTST
jgi:hypothetical protein